MGTKVFKYDNKGNVLTNTYYSYNSEKTLDELEETQGSVIKLTYDARGMLAGIGSFETLYGNDGSTYYYRKDPFGNVVALLDRTGNVVLKYTYDAWGKFMLEGTNYQLGMVNPFTYRGYYYDFETGLFCVSSRCYDPQVGRFISADDISYLDPNTVGGTHYALQHTGKMAIKTNINKLVNNPLDDFVTVGPKDGGISNYVRSISQTGDYG